jgi:Protein of unknown function (DUF3047)
MKKGIWWVSWFFLNWILIQSPLAQEGTLWVENLYKKSSDNIPEGWKLEKKTGTPEITIEKSREFPFVCFKSDRASYGLAKEMDFNINEYPYLNWKWKVDRLPEKGNFLDRKTDDQAAQVYVLFPRFPAKLNTDIVGYIWESNPKNKGKEGNSPAWKKSKVIVLQAGPERLNQWIQEKRNVYEDYKRLFGKEPPGVGGVSLYINTQHTQDDAETCFGPIYFSKK